MTPGDSKAVAEYPTPEEIMERGIETRRCLVTFPLFNIGASDGEVAYIAGISEEVAESDREKWRKVREVEIPSEPMELTRNRKARITRRARDMLYGLRSANGALTCEHEWSVVQDGFLCNKCDFLWHKTDARNAFPGDPCWRYRLLENFKSAGMSERDLWFAERHLGVSLDPSNHMEVAARIRSDRRKETFRMFDEGEEPTPEMADTFWTSNVAVRNDYKSYRSALGGRMTGKIRTARKVQRRVELTFPLFDEGLTNREVAELAGVHYSTAYNDRKAWEAVRGEEAYGT